jgi:hypothetical protein
MDVVHHVAGRATIAPMQNHDSKPCAACGRAMTWRRKWANTWSEVKYCSDACRRRGVRDVDEALERAIVSLLARRGAGKSICPSEVARAVGAATWPDLMEPARRAARRLAQRGEVIATQHDKIVDASKARGPIRVRLAD